MGTIVTRNAKRNLSFEEKIMLFYFNLYNHDEDRGQRSLEDVVGIISHQLRALGHEVIWERSNDHFVAKEHGINLVFEGFTESSIATIDAHYPNARFVYIATEEPSDKGFNKGETLQMVKRQKIFCEATRYCEGILHLVPGDHVTKWYSQFAPTSHIELGYAPSLVRTDDFKEPDFDFGFFGYISRRRAKILKRLSKITSRGVFVESNFSTQTKRDDDMRRARVIVQIKKDDKLQFVSSSRCNTALHLGRPVVAEPHAQTDLWGNVIKFSETLESFYNDCFMARSAWRGVHATQMDKFRNVLSPEFCIGRALKEINLDLNFQRAA